jgi:hypothetical protein
VKGSLKVVPHSNKKNSMVSVDTVYQTVLAILNKENRGYMTPQEFNLLANQTQSEIFEQYFYDLNQYNRRGEITNEFANIVKNIKEKIDLFKVQQFPLVYSTNKFNLPTNLYRVGSIDYRNTTEVEQITNKEYLYYSQSPLTAPKISYPMYIREENSISVYPDSIASEIFCTYIRKPASVNWTYNVVSNEAFYNPGAPDAQDFEVHESEISNLVIKILSYAGIVIKQAEIIQLAEAKENKKITQEKS